MKHVIMCFVASLLLSLVSIPMLAQQQSRLISGIIKDESGEPMIGASVLDVSTKQGTIADMDGKFTLEVTSSSKLQISFVGYKDQIISGKDLKKNMIIVLKSNTEMIDELVVVGYGSQKKETLTGAVSQISNKEVTTTKNENLTNALAGKIPGVRVVQNSSEPGTFNTAIDIRGLGSPLIVIDGVPRDNMQRIDPDDVETISVLKDASAAVYGVRASNGVILITTKKGKNNSPEVSYNGNFTWQKPSNFPDLVNAEEWMVLNNELKMHLVDGGGIIYSDDVINEYRTGKKQSTDWKSAVMKSVAPQTQHTLNISGGTDKINYYTSFGYMYQGSFLATDDINYDKFNLRSNISGKITNNLKFDLKLYGMLDERQTPTYDSWNIIRAMWLMNPVDPIFYDESENKYIQPANTGLMNPVAIMNSDNVGYCSYQSKWFQSSLGMTYDIPWVEGLSVSGMYSYDYILNDNKTYQKTWNLYRDNLKYTYLDPSKVSRYFYGKTNTLWQVKADYQHNFKGHNVNATVIYEESMKEGDNFYGTKELSLPIDQVFAGNSENQQFGQDTNQAVLYQRSNKAFIGRFTYDYLSKYLFEFAFRYEGSSMFPANARWKLFPSVFGGWRISEEKFWKESKLNFINNLKLRASYGILGDDSVLAYQFLQGYKYPDGGCVFGDGWVGGITHTGPANNNISWIKAKSFNIGADLEAWSGLFGLTAEYFIRERSGLLATRNTSLPGLIGTTLPQENLNGDISRGYEIEVSHKNIIGDFAYQVKGNLAFTRTTNTYVESARAGNSYLNWRQNSNDRFNNVWWGYEGNGRFTDWNSIYYSPVMVGRGTILGDYNYLDWNGDGIISDLDVHPIATSGDRPMMNFGLTFNASYKNFDLNLLFQGAAMRYIAYEELLYEPLWGGSNALSQFMDRWHPKDPYADPYNPALEWEEGYYGYTGSRPDKNSTYNMQNAAYLRLKNIEIGYTLPVNWMNKVNIKSMRIYLSAYNLLTFTPLKYLDPEFPSSSQGYNYPLNKTITLGLNLKF